MKAHCCLMMLLMVVAIGLLWLCSEMGGQPSTGGWGLSQMRESWNLARLPWGGW